MTLGPDVIIAHGRDLGAGLHEPEDVVDEEQNILLDDVTEVLGHG